MKKTILLLVAALTIMLAVVVNDQGDVAVISSGGGPSSGSVAGNLPSLPPLLLIDNVYADDPWGPNNCNVWEGDSDYHNLGWHFKTADVELPSGLNLAVAPSPAGFVHDGEPEKVDLVHGWNYWWKINGPNDTELDARFIVLSADAGPNPCSGPTALTFTLSGELLDGHTWFVDVFTAT